ncbi:hypothetical protein [Polyangium mundeleinium]|uniref:Uncharacterized protein n=1 Tax=Polyangium mundeleinium TaxID=2995306 RepID=A0ABT5ETB0_9BACT|nr:hypothetical protein [Polyangium mundeleinium]MDC0744438.1 hypothetical protein [Polyangium mundeleinium]
MNTAPGDASDATLDRSEERHRLVAMAAGVPLFLLCAPIVLPFGGPASLLEAADGGTAPVVLLAGLAFPPLLAGVVGLVRGYKRVAPGRWLFGVPAVASTLLALGMVLVVTLLLLIEPTARYQPFVWVGLVGALGALGCLVRGFFRKGFHRFSHVVGGIWLCGLVLGVSLRFSPKPFFTAPSWGAGFFFFGLAALAPLVGFAFAPRRA